MNHLSLLSALSGFVFLAGFFPYVVAILRGRTRPTRATWFIWTLLALITTGSLYAHGSLTGLVIGAVVGDVVVTALSIRYGKPGWNTVDLLSLVGACAAGVLWLSFENPVLAVMVVVAVGLLGALPSWLSVWRAPERESLPAWSLFALASLLAVLAVPTWDFMHAAVPVGFFLNNAPIVALFFLAPRLPPLGFSVNPAMRRSADAQKRKPPGIPGV
jgi:hypothetical protein